MGEDEMHAKKILVTGGLGFIGKHLCKKLLRSNCEVVSFDNRCQASSDAEKFILSEVDASSAKRFKSLHGSILDQQCINCLAMQDFNCIYHLAAVVGVKNVVDNPLKTMSTNFLGTQNVLELAAMTKTPTFIASSSEVYGKSENIPFSEDSDLVLGKSTISRWSYAASKIANEFQAFSFSKELQLPVVIGRFFNIVGAGQLSESGMVIPKMVEAALREKRLEVLGNGFQKRCFCHVDDCVEALVAMMLGPFKENAIGQIFNVGNPDNEISMLELGEKIIDMCGNRSELSIVPYSKIFKAEDFEDVQRRMPSIEKLKNAVKWIPLKTLDEILEDVISSLQNINSN